MRLRLPSTFTLLTFGPLMQVAAVAEAWHALALGGLLLAASCLHLYSAPSPLAEPEPELQMNTVPTGRARSKFRGYAPWTPRSPQARPPQPVVSTGWSHVEDWFY